MIALALRQLRREPLITLILTAALLLVSAFAALAPLYVRMVTTAELDARLNALNARQQRLELSSNMPIGDDTLPLLVSQLEGIGGNASQFAYAPSRFCGLFMESPVDLPTYIPCYRQYTYPDLAEEFIAVEGRLPQPSPDVLEIALTTQMLEKSRLLDAAFNYPLGIRFSLTDSNAAPVTVELVGIVQPRIPEDDPHWDAQESVFGSIILSAGNAPDELEFGLLVHPDVFATGYAINTARLYVGRVGLNLSQLKVGSLETIQTGIESALAAMRMANPALRTVSPIETLLRDFQARIAEIMPPVTLLVVLALLLLIYMLVMTGSLVLDRSRRAWAQMSGRGATPRQLIAIHAISMAVLGLVASGLSIPTGFLLSMGLAWFGPQAEVIEPLAFDAIPLQMLLFGLGASGTGVLALIMPGIPTALTHFAQLQSASGRPGAKPLWKRYFLDVIAAATGALLVLRTRGGASLDDPFSLIGPGLLLIGITLLWLRLFPLLMRGLGYLLGLLNRLSVRMALWTLERHSGSYSQLVILIVGTLALGTASLVLNETRSNNAWQTARGLLATDAVLYLNPRQVDPDFPYTDTAGIIHAQPLIIVESGGTTDRPQTIVLGYQKPDAPVIAALQDIEFAFTGETLPEDAAAISLDVYSAASAPATETGLSLEIINGDQRRVIVPMQVADPMLAETWQTFHADLNGIQLGRLPWRVSGLRITSDRVPVDESRPNARRFDHSINIGRLLVTGEDGTISRIGTEPSADWSRTATTDNTNNVFSMSGENSLTAPDGSSSLRLLYVRNTISRDRFPALSFQASDEPIPVLVTAALAQAAGERSTLRRPLQVGDVLFGEYPDLNDTQRVLRVSYRVISIIDTPAPYHPNQQMIVTRADYLQSQLNQGTPASQQGSGINRVLLELADRVPTDELRAAINAVPGFESADYAYDRFENIQRDPLANAVTGMLLAGFWSAFGLLILQLSFYTVIALRRRAPAFAVLRSLGWGSDAILMMLIVEEVAVILPALLMGVGAGIGLAALLSPLIDAAEGVLTLPLGSVAGLLIAILVLIAGLLIWSGMALRRLAVVTQIRVTE
jgi:hypothetical protein